LFDGDFILDIDTAKYYNFKEFTFKAVEVLSEMLKTAGKELGE
jgi:hypothetical protein